MTELDWLKESAIKEVATPMRRTLHVNFFNTLASGVAIRGVRGVRTPCQENTYFLGYVISQCYRPTCKT